METIDMEYLVNLREVLGGLNMKRGFWRAQRVDPLGEYDKWIYGVQCGKFIICNYAVRFNNNMHRRCSDYPKGNEYPVFDYEEIKPSTLGECTGIPDKNDNLIFEGDNIKAKYRAKTVIGFVEYDSYIGAFVLNDGVYGYKFGSDILSKECEVIGNIHDNPELLISRRN